MASTTPLARAWDGIFVYGRAVRLQFERLHPSEENRLDRADLMADVTLMVFALRGLLRAAELMVAIVGVSAVADAVEAFRQCVPDLVDARDVLEHFDDYVTEASTRPKKRQHITEFRPRITAWSPRSAEEIELRIEVGGYTIDLSRAAEASNSLLGALLTNMDIVRAAYAEFDRTHA